MKHRRLAGLRGKRERTKRDGTSAKEVRIRPVEGGNRDGSPHLMKRVCDRKHSRCFRKKSSIWKEENLCL